MIITGGPILTVGQMRATEEAAIAAGASVSDLMERAGAGIASWVHRLAAGAETLILCGSGNNGGDGYVAARILAANGHMVRVAASGEPRTPAAAAARVAWTGPIESLSTSCAPVLIDALFGTGLSRLLDAPIATSLDHHLTAAKLAIAVDLPSFVDSDTGAILGPSCAGFDVTLALGALKPAHILEPAATRCGTLRTVDIGIDGIGSPVQLMSRAAIAPPDAAAHKYRRGLVSVIGGPMHGASELAALAAYRAGAGYVRLHSGGLPHPPHAIVRQRWSADALVDPRIGAAVIGPGLGRDDRARDKLAIALASDRPLVIDGDALHLIDLDTLGQRTTPAILTPHAGEFAALFGNTGASKIARTQDAARHSNAIVVFKGADTIIAAPDGRAMILPLASPWLSTAGTGDVLTGAIAAILAQHPHAPFEAAAVGAWLHGRAAALLDRCFLADELADMLPFALKQAHV